MAGFSVKKLVNSALRQLTYPHDPREFFQVFNPLASSQYTRGMVTRVVRETDRTSTISFRVGDGWVPHVAGQWARIGVEIDGKRVWRPYSISAAEGQDPSITVKHNGKVSGFLSQEARPGMILYLERPSGQFVLGDGDSKLLFIVAGSGITPVMSMLRTLMPRRPDHDVVLIYSSRSVDDVVFGEEILELADQFPGLQPKFWFTEQHNRLDFGHDGDVEALVPDYRERRIYTCGPDSFVTQVQALAELHGGDVVLERFDVARRASGGGEGEIYFAQRDVNLEVRGTESILEASERAGMDLPHGCRMGICQSCIQPMLDGAVEHIRTGEIFSEPGLIQTCSTRPAPAASLDL